MSELIRIAVLLASVNTVPAPTVACCAEAPAAQSVDAWFGSDKVPHFWMSYATTAFTFAAISAAGGDTDTALMAGVGAGAVAGIGKEIHDWRRGWTFSIKDLTVDALGVAAAYFFLREVR